MKQTLIAFDQLLNTLFRGWADETISARAYRNSSKFNKKWRSIKKAIDALFFWQPNHCYQSYLMEIERLQMPPAYRMPPQ